jgi:hypothetical protein
MNPGRKELARIRKSVWYVGPIISPFVSRYTEGSAVAWVNRALHRGKGPSTGARLPTGEVRIGKRVRIRANHRRWPLRGLEGGIDKRWGNPDHVALDVLLDDGRFRSCSGTTSWRRSPKGLAVERKPIERTAVRVPLR